MKPDRLRLLLLSPLLAAAATPRPVAPIQSYDSYKSWFIACDNALRCVARGISESDEAKVEIARDAGPAGKIEMSLAAASRFAPAAVRLDGKPLGLAAADWHDESDEQGTTLSTAKPALIRSLVTRLRNGTKIALGGATVPLDGFSAAMLRMDERQGRIGGVTALIRSGPAAASLVPAAPALPHVASRRIAARLSAGEAKQLIAKVRSGQRALLADEGCEASPGGMEAEAHALDDRRALVLIPCMMGAYQGSSLGFIATRATGSARLLDLPLPYQGNDTEHADTRWLTSAEFDPEKGMLSMAAKGRGLGDCGTAASWNWEGSGFRLASMSYQQACGGYGAGDWPDLYRSLP
jgi:hypothetical protein